MANAATEMTSALSSWRTRESTVYPNGRTSRIRNDRTNGVGHEGDLERRWRGIVRDGDLQLRRGALVDPEIMRDGAGDERCDRGAVPRELDDGADHDLRLVGRRQPDEPALIEPVRILCRPRLSRDGEIGEAPTA